MTSAYAAAEFCDSFRELIEPFMLIWATEKIGKLIGKHRAKARREGNPQLAFEGMLGLKRLPEQLELKPGVFVPRSKSTIGGFRRWARDLRRKESPYLAYANKAIALMSPYVTDKKRITWGEVIEQEAAKRRSI